MPASVPTPDICRRSMIQFRLVVSLPVVVLLLFAQVGPLLAFPHHANSDAELEFGLHQRSHLDAKAGPEGESLAGVPNWNNEAPEWDELTRCIRSSESGDTIARWLNCLESLEKFTAPDSAALSSTGLSSKIASSYADVNDSLQLAEDRMEPFDPLAGGSSKLRKNLNSSDGNSTGGKGLVSARVQDSAPGLADENRTLADADVSREQGSGTSSGVDIDMSENSGVSPSRISSKESSLLGRDNALGDADTARSSASKWEADTSRSLQSSSGDENVGCLEVLTEASNSTSSTTRLQNLLDALKLAACLGVVTKLLWGKRAQLLASGQKAQSGLTGQAVECLAPPTKQYSKAGFSSLNNDVGAPSVKVGGLSTPLGMAIATVMAEALHQEDGRRPPRTADELSKLLEAALIETLSPVMGSECPGFVEQFKQSFSSTYRLLGSVRSASSRNFASSFANHSRDVSQRRPEAPSRECHRQTDAEEDDSSGLTKKANLDLAFNSRFRLPNRKHPDPQADLADQFSKLTLPVHGLEAVAKSVDVKGASSDGENSSCVDQEVFGEPDDISSSVGLDDVSEGLSEKGTGHRVPLAVHPIGIRNRLERRGLEKQTANQQIYRQERGSSLEPGDADLAMQPFETTSNDQLVAVFESSLAHYDSGTCYQQQKILLSQQEMELRKMELNLKFRELHLKEANLHLASENNTLMREHVDLSRNKVEFKEAEYQDRKLTAAHAIFAKRCADEMVAGLCVMLCALFFGAWKYSHERLVDIVSTCQPTLYEPSNSYVPGFNTVVNSLNHMSSRLHMFVCEVTVASRMLLGLGIISFVAAALLRKSVASNSQAMPATILIVVLGGICGFAGKLAVDSLGGSGYHWLLMWEAFCLVHTLGTCFTSTLYRILNGTPESVTGKWQWQRQTYFMKPWLRRFWFHVTMVLVLPILTGLIPFAHLREVVQLVAFNFWHLAYSPIESYLRKNHSQLTSVKEI